MRVAIPLTIFVAAIVVLLGMFSLAHGAPPAGADQDSAAAQWYRSLQTPQGSSCCSEADCRAYSDDKVRQRAGSWQVFIEGDWRRVPSERVLRGKANPTGSAVACWLPSTGVLCFVEPFMT